VKAIKSDSDSDSDEQKRSLGFQEKNRGLTPSVAAPGVTHPSDAIVGWQLEVALKCCVLRVSSLKPAKLT